MKKSSAIALALVGALIHSGVNAAEDIASLAKAALLAAQNTSTYRLAPNDLIEIKVYQEEDLTTKLRLAKDGTGTFPLLGVVNLGGMSVDECAAHLRDLLGKDYLVNPQVTITVVEYAKRRFTVLGQVQKPGSFEIPNEESVTLLQAIAMAGGYTRLADTGRVTVTRVTDGKKMTYRLNVKSATNDTDTKPFEIQPDDTITVSERIF
jgi:polysaccharide export outer membrane protein